MGIRTALVSGGGIGGLAAAAALAQRGVGVELVEIKERFDVHGVGLGQPVNALRALRDIGVVDEVIDHGFAFDSFRICDREGNVLLDYRYRLADPVLPPIVALPRKDLHEILIAAAGAAGVTLRLGTHVTALSSTPEAAQVTFSDGTRGEFDLVVGFDGIHSPTREHVLGQPYPLGFSGSSAWRVTVPRHPSIASMDFYQGFGSKTGFMPLTDELMYMFHIRPEPPEAWYDSSRFLAMLTERLEEYAGVVAEVRAGLSEADEIVYSPLRPHLVTDPWYRGRVVIGGDAAHAFPPHMTQGAGMALEDAIVLAEEVTTKDDIADALAAYFDRRFDRCAFVGQFARRMLDDEQRIKGEADLRDALPLIQTHQAERLVLGDRTMNRAVLASDPRKRERLPA